MTDYTKKVVVGGSLVFMFTVIAALFGYLVRLVIARNLTPIEFGLLYSIFSTFGLLVIIKDFGLRDSLVKFIAEFKVKKELSKIKTAIIFTLSFQFILSFSIAIVFWLFAPYLAQHYFKNELAIHAVRLYCLVVFLSPIENVLLAIFRGYQKMKWVSGAKLARMIFIFLATIILFNFDKSITSPILAYILVFSLSFIVYIPYFLTKLFPQFFKVKIGNFKKIAKKMILFGLPLIITLFMAEVILHIDTVMITYFRNITEVALYNVASPTAHLLWFFGSSMAIVLLPLSSEIWKKKQKNLLKEGITMLYKYSIFLIFPFAILMIAFPEFILLTLFGEGYSAGGVILKIFAFSSLFFTIAQINISIISGTGNPKVNAKISAIGAGINLLLNFILVPTTGMIGAAISTLAAFLIMAMVGSIELKKIVSLKVPFFDWTKNTLCAGMFFITLLLLKWNLDFNLIPKIAITLILGAAVYLIMGFLLRLITIEEIRVIKSRIINR